MGRRKGSQLTPEHRARIRDSVSRYWVRQSLPEVWGDLMMSTAARRDFMRETMAYARMVTADLQYILDHLSDADEARLAEWSREMRLNDQELTDYQKTLLLGLRMAMAEKDSPYAGIPWPAERAEARRRIQDTWQGEPLTGPLPHLAAGIQLDQDDDDGPPDVAPDQTRHPPMRGRHSHDHAAGGAPDAQDGLHRHSHAHSGDAIHSHGHGDA
jgi:hypothetical protein